MGYELNCFVWLVLQAEANSMQNALTRAEARYISNACAFYAVVLLVGQLTFLLKSHSICTKFCTLV